MKKTKVEAYDELVEGIDRGYFLYMSGVGPWGDGEAQVIGYEINEDAHPGKEDLEEEGFADEDEWWRAYRGQEAVVVDRPMGQGGSNFRILDSLDVGKDFDIYYYGNGFEESPQKKDPKHWHKDRNEVLSAMYERKIDLNNLFERVMNGAATLREEAGEKLSEIWDDPNRYYGPREPRYASKPSERELALEREFEVKFTIEFNGELVEVMPLGKGRALIKQTGSGIQDWDAQTMLNRIRSKAEGALYNNENFFLDVRRPDHYSASLVQWFLRVLNDGTVLANDIDGTKKFETVDEALETCAPMWEKGLMRLFKK